LVANSGPEPTFAQDMLHERFRRLAVIPQRGLCSILVRVAFLLRNLFKHRPYRRRTVRQQVADFAEDLRSLVIR